MANNQNLRPAKKGEVRNPKGKVKGTKNRATILKQLVAVTLKYKNPVTDEEVRGLIEEQIGWSLVAKALTGDVQAIKEINDTLYGKIPDKQTVEHSGKIKISFKHD